VKKIVSGGQTGVDQAALRVGLALGIEIGGWCPLGRACEDGVIPAEFPLQPTPRDRSELAPDLPRSLRTEWNVRDSDGTLVLHDHKAGVDPGSRFAIEVAQKVDRPILVLALQTTELAIVHRWLAGKEIQILNVSGPSEGAIPGIGALAESILTNILM
jgi:hypothetical protein